MSYFIIFFLALTANLECSLGAISCFSRWASSSSDNGIMKGCSADFSCYSWSNSSYNYAGCGTCGNLQSNISYYPMDCTTCSSDYCNVQPMVMCYSMWGPSPAGSGVAYCYGSASCYAYSYNYGVSSMVYASGCGNCAGYSTSYPNCRSCSNNLCNTFDGISTSASPPGGGGGFPMSAGSLASNFLAITAGIALVALTLMW